jgi:hypothetical protein
MLFLIIFTIAAQLLIFGFAIKCGDRVLRLGAIWISINILVHTVLTVSGLRSPTFHLINDGVFATGLLPLAFFSVSPSVGVLALLACGSFILQSSYLLTDRHTDAVFIQVNDAINVGYLLTFLIGTIAAVVSRRRERAESAPAPAATPEFVPALAD